MRQQQHKRPRLITAPRPDKLGLVPENTGNNGGFYVSFSERPSSDDQWPEGCGPVGPHSVYDIYRDESLRRRAARALRRGFVSPDNIDEIAHLSAIELSALKPMLRDGEDWNRLVEQVVRRVTRSVTKRLQRDRSRLVSLDGCRSEDGLQTPDEALVGLPIDGILSPQAPTPADILIRLESISARHRAFYLAMDRLPAAKREIVIERMNGMTFKDIAAKHGIKQALVTSRYRRAISDLRELILSIEPDWPPAAAIAA